MTGASLRIYKSFADDDPDYIIERVRLALSLVEPGCCTR